MQKRGSVVVDYLILLILALVVLVVVIIIFTKGFNGLFDYLRSAVKFTFNLKPKGL